MDSFFKHLRPRHQADGTLVFDKGVAIMIKLGKVSMETQAGKSIGPSEPSGFPLFPA